MGALVESCAAESSAAAEPLAGTAPGERAFLCVEQAPPWGYDAVRESGLDRNVAEHLLDRALEAGVRVMLVRSSARSGLRGTRVFTAWTGPAPFLTEHEIHSPEELRDLDLRDLGRGVRPAAGAERARPLFLVCTNGRRDACCARYGRPAASALGELLPDDTWECTHLGGHRFAATMLALPSGLCFGRLDPGTIVETARALLRGEVAPELLRGRAGVHPALQVAEATVRRERGLRAVDDVLPIDFEDGQASLDVRGEHVTVELALGDLGRLRASCGKEHESTTAWIPLGSARETTEESAGAHLIHYYGWFINQRFGKSCF